MLMVRGGIRNMECQAMFRLPPHTREFLLHNNGQVHARMNGTVEFEGASCGKWADGARTIAVDLYISDFGCARFSGGFGCAVDPCPVGDDMRHRQIVIY